MRILHPTYIYRSVEDEGVHLLRNLAVAAAEKNFLSLVLLAQFRLQWAIAIGLERAKMSVRNAQKWDTIQIWPYGN